MQYASTNSVAQSSDTEKLWQEVADLASSTGLNVKDTVKVLSDAAQILQQLTQSSRDFLSAFARILDDAEAAILTMIRAVQTGAETAPDLIGGGHVPELMGQTLSVIPTITGMLTRAAEAVTSAAGSPAPVGPMQAPSSTAETGLHAGSVVDVAAMNRAVADFEVALRRLEIALDKATDIHVTVAPSDDWD
jgi:ABC-type transporter Mla subunit MlaD